MPLLSRFSAGDAVVEVADEAFHIVAVDHAVSDNGGGIVGIMYDNGDGGNLVLYAVDADLLSRFVEKGRLREGSHGDDLGENVNLVFNQGVFALPYVQIHALNEHVGHNVNRREHSAVAVFPEREGIVHTVVALKDEEEVGILLGMIEKCECFFLSLVANHVDLTLDMLFRGEHTEGKNEDDDAGHGRGQSGCDPTARCDEHNNGNGEEGIGEIGDDRPTFGALMIEE